MGDLTLIRLVAARREKELRARPRWGACDLLALPLAGLFILAAVVCVSVVSLAAAAARVGAALRVRRP